MADTTNYNALAGALLTRGGAAGIVVAAAANVDVLVETSGYSTLIVEADMSAGAGADLGLQVNPVAETGSEIYPLSQPAIQSVGPTLVSGRAYMWAQYDVEAQQRVRIRMTNNNAGQETLDYDWRTV